MVEQESVRLFILEKHVLKTQSKTDFFPFFSVSTHTKKHVNLKPCKMALLSCIKKFLNFCSCDRARTVYCGDKKNGRLFFAVARTQTRNNTIIWKRHKSLWSLNHSIKCSSICINGFPTHCKSVFHFCEDIWTTV